MNDLFFSGGGNTFAIVVRRRTFHSCVLEHNSFPFVCATVQLKIVIYTCFADIHFDHLADLIRL